LNLIPVLAFIPILFHFKKIRTISDPLLLDPELKKLALSTFFLSLLFYLSFNNFL
jgi:1,4-dihydroxy-2-naphthoate octaprenyltransferase